MKKTHLWVVVSCLMALSLVLVSCGQAEEEETTGPGITVTTEEKEQAKEEEKAIEEEEQEEEVVSSDEPRYGGTLRLVQNSDITGWDDIITRSFTPGATFRITNESPWAGDWAKGPAGGYGTGESDWASYYDVFALNAGHVAESWEWSADEANDEGTLVYQIRQGVHFALNPDSEASLLVGGREMTADDVVFSLKQMVTINTAYVYKSNPDLRGAEITKTGPWEVTIKLPLQGLVQAISRFGNYGRVVPPEVVEKYGDMRDWRNSVGTGPFMLVDYVASSAATLVRNPNYWMKDPVGPGKGNQLPYLDGFKFLIIGDSSTRLAALRTGKLDQMFSINWEDAAQLRVTTPELLETEGGLSGYFPTYIRTDTEPFTDVRVRRAMMMAIDFEEIRQTLNGGFGQIITFPFEYSNAYADLYLGLDDPEMPESVKELYVYNPDKARDLLAEAGYPNGFKTEVLINNTQVDYYSIFQDMWSKVGIELELDVKEQGVITSIINPRKHNALSSMGRGPVSIFYLAPSLLGEGGSNQSMINDPIINEAMAEIRITAAMDQTAAMKQMKELMKYVLDQAYAIPRPTPPSFIMWWPWIKNYSGENSMGYFVSDFWTTWVWLDQDLKKDMGY